MSQSEENPQEMQIDLALAEYMQKCDSGEVPDREAFLDRHPELREHLAHLLITADWIEELAGPRLADIVSGSESPSYPLGLGSGDTAQTADVAKIRPFAQMSTVDEPSLEETLPLANGLFGSGGAPSRENSHNSGSFDAGDPLQNTLPLFGSFGGGNAASQEFSLTEESPQATEFLQPLLPCRFGEYVLERVLGRGGMGVVYFGRQVQLERPVAIKMIRSGALASHEEVMRFYSEARSAARLDHPNIVTVYQCGECEGHRYFSMDFVPGSDLSRMIEAGPLEPKRAARYVRDVARAIQYAHDRGILHRDLKPANVLIDEQDQVRITDFGLAKSIGSETGLTAAGAALGTPSYMSPEQAAGRLEEQNSATDVYSLGAVLFTIVTGKPPFKAAGVLQTIMQVIHRPAPMARTLRADVPEDLETIIDVCLQKSSERRYASATAMADDLNRFLQGSPIQARPVSASRRAWYWLLGIPIVGAILDNRVVEPTEAHRWVQRCLISIALLFLLTWMTVLIPTSTWVSNRMPRTIRVAGGTMGGHYDKLAGDIAELLLDQSQSNAMNVESAGSNENFERLENGDVQLALLQGDAVNVPSIAVVAPLFYEAVHILVKAELPLESVADLENCHVVIGSVKSGSRGIAKMVLAHSGLSLDDIELDETDWRSLIQNSQADAAIVVTKEGAADMVRLLHTGKYRLLPFADAWQFAMDEPVFHPTILKPSIYPECNLPESGTATIAITAYLAARMETPPVLVQTVLKKLFDPEVVQRTGIFPAARAAGWQIHGWHPAAREFFQAYRGSAIEPLFTH